MTAPTTPPGPAGPGSRPNPPAGGGAGLPPTTVVAGAPPKSPKPTKDEKRGKRWSMAERLLAVLAAGLSVVAGGLGIWGTQVSSERDELATTTDSLVEQRDDLDAQLDDAQARIDDLETAASSTTTTSTTAPDTTLTTSTDANVPPRPGEPIFLNQFDPVAGDVNTDEAELGGQRYRNLVRTDVVDCSRNPDVVEYNLGSGYEKFTAKVGPSDTIADSSDAWRFVVTTIDANGEHILFEQEMQVAQVADVDVSVAGAQRLRLTIEQVDRDTESNSCSTENNAAIWADPRLT